MQPYFFPYLGYFQAISAVDKYFIYSNLNYIKESWVHKNRIRIKNSGHSAIMLGLTKPSSFSKINEIRLSSAKQWRVKILNAIYLNYNKNVGFETFYPIIKQILEYDTDKLSEINYQSISQTAAFLDIATQITEASEKYNYLEEQLDKMESSPTSILANQYPGMERKTIRVMEICRDEKADVFINAINGRTLYDKNTFANYGISLFFIKTEPYSYPQNGHDFIPDLSIIDVIMNLGKEKTKELLQNYTLI